MTNKKLHKIFTKNYSVKSEQLGHWQIEVEGKELVCLTDQYHNRMRIICPIIYAEQVRSEELVKCMEANFHTALDVRYAISNELLWSAFIHPLKELTEQQVKEAVSQVYVAAMTFGSSYNSSNLYFRKSEDT